MSAIRSECGDSHFEAAQYWWYNNWQSSKLKRSGTHIVVPNRHFHRAYRRGHRIDIESVTKLSATNFWIYWSGRSVNLIARSCLSLFRTLMCEESLDQHIEEFCCKSWLLTRYLPCGHYSQNRTFENVPRGDGYTVIYMSWMLLKINFERITSFSICITYHRWTITPMPINWIEVLFQIPSPPVAESQFQNEWDKALPYEKIPGPSRLTLIKDSLPGGGSVSIILLRNCIWLTFLREIGNSKFGGSTGTVSPSVWKYL